MGSCHTSKYLPLIPKDVKLEVLLTLTNQEEVIKLDVLTTEPKHTEGVEKKRTLMNSFW
jgi:hypothetical protein